MYIYVHICIYIYTVYPSKSGHQIGNPMSEFWNFPNFEVYIFFDRKIKKKLLKITVLYIYLG